MRRVTDEDLRTLEAIAGLATVACRNAEAYEHVQHAARTDALTGVLNHGAMQLRIREEIARARRDGAPLGCRDPRPRRLQDRQRRRAATRPATSCCGASPTPLQRRAARLRPGRPLRRRRVRRCCSPAPTSAGGRAVAERCRDAVAGGVLDRRRRLARAADADELLEQADRALMLAKRTGKGRVAVANAGVEHELALLEARAGSPDAIMREFWEMVAASESSRQTLLTLPSFVHRAIDADEVALYELGDDDVLVQAAAACREGEDVFQIERVQATSAIRERLPLGAISRPTLAGLLAAIGADEPPEARRAPAGAYAVVPLLWAGRPHGLIAVRTRRELSTERLRLLELVARQTMAVFTAQPESGSPAAVQALAAAIEARDNYTHEHSEQVVSLATDVARLLGLSPSEQDTVRHGALLHDVGKLAIPNEILHKPGPAQRRRVARDGRAPRDRRADPAPHAAARAPRADRAPRARALGRHRLPRRPGRHGDPDRARGSSSPATPTTR